MARVVVVGAGVAGLGTALYAGRAGHDVVIIERDDTPLPADPGEAFLWNRRGAPQVRHSHAFLARLRNQIRDDHPDVLAALLDVGATEMDFISMLPEHMDQTRLAGDEDLVALACRRTTFEWVLRRIVTDEGSTRLVHAAGVRGLLRDTRNPSERVPVVTGVSLDDGTEECGDMVVLAGGRRMDVPALVAEVGATVAETAEDTGIIYLSRFFRLRDGEDHPPQVGPIGGDLGFLKFGVFLGDDRTYSVTLSTGTDDTELRRKLLDPETFLAAAEQIPGTAAYVDGRAVALTEVEVMGGLINRRRDFMVDGSPVVAGVHAVGDAHTATNPLYGRGCSLAMVQAKAVVEALDAHGDDHDGRAVHYEAVSATEVVPWHRAAVRQDRMGRSGPPEGAGDGEAVGDATRADFMRSLLRDGLMPAMRVDPVVLRAFLRMFNLLDPPDALMTNTDVMGRVLAVYQDKDQRPPEPPLGPDRAELLAHLG